LNAEKHNILSNEYADIHHLPHSKLSPPVHRLTF